MWVVENLVGESGGLRSEKQNIAGLVGDVGVRTRGVRGVREHPRGAESRPGRWQVPVHGDGRQIVVVQAGPFELGLGHVEPERAYQVQLASGAGHQANGIAGVLGDAGLEEHQSKHPVHSATTNRGSMGQVDDEQIIGEDFSDTRLDGQEWNGRQFVRCTFRDADMSGVRTDSVVFTECDFTGTDLTESTHTNSAFRSCTFTRTNLQHSTFRHSTMMGSVFVDSRMRPAVYDEVDFTLAALGNVDLRGLDLTGCRMREANLVSADFRKAILRSVDFAGARTVDAKFDEADLRGAVADQSLWVSASVRGAKIELMQAVAYAGANGLVVEG